MKVNLKQLSGTAFLNTEFFFCCWDPKNELNIEVSKQDDFDVFSEGHFWAVTSKPKQTTDNLINDYENKAILFRGYDLDLSIHSYSSSDEKKCLIEGKTLNNGVFAYFEYDKKLHDLYVKSDAFGVSPLYYRVDNGKYYFSSHPALIHFSDDKPDLISWLSLMQNGYIFGDRSYFEETKRVLAGGEMFLSKQNVKTNHWFDFSQLPKGEKSIDDEAFSLVEDACQNAITQCLKLKQHQVVLPFSSGYDSRRFFASFHHKKLKFKAVTCQSYHAIKGKFYDIDAPCAAAIANHFGVDHEVIPSVSADVSVANNKKRIALIGSESFMHEWALPMMEWFSHEPSSLVFDGLSGDTLGNSGFDTPGLHESFKKDTEIILQTMVNKPMFGHLASFWPSLSQYTAEYKKEIEKFPASLNQIELAFLQFRSRRSISPMTTMMMPPGHVVVYPYYDLDFINTCLSYNPADKFKYFFQKECLKRSWPEYYDFDGSRNLPENYAPLDQKQTDIINAINAMNESGIDKDDIQTELFHYLNFPNKILWLAAQKISVFKNKRAWLFDPLSELIRFGKHSPGIINFFR